MTGPTIYRGKHPHRVESVFSMDPAHPDAQGWRWGLRTNAGAVYGFPAVSGGMPARIGDHGPDVPGAVFLYQSSKRKACA